MGEGFETLHLTLWDAFFFLFSYPNCCETTCTGQSCGGEWGSGEAEGGLWQTIQLNPHPTVLSTKDVSPHTRLAATAKSPNIKKASEGVPKVSALDHILTLTHVHNHTLKHKWPELQKSEVQMNCRKKKKAACLSTLSLQLLFLRSQPPLHHRRSPCPHSSPSLFFSVHEETKTKSARFHSASVKLKKNMLITPSSGCGSKDNPSPWNPSLQISGTCWRRCACPSRAAPLYVSDKAAPGKK